MQYRPQWVAWRYMERENGTWTKPPVNPWTGADADVSNPATWAIWREARGRQLEDNLPGVGFVLTADDGLVGIDLDDCVDLAGNVAPWAAQIIETVDSYTEFSPSGAGVHILAFGSLPPGRRRAGPVEMYEANRYLTFTGHVLNERRGLYERSQALATVHAQYLAGFATPGTATQPTERPAAPTSKPAAASTAPTLDDLAIVEKLFRSRAAPWIARLWTGDTSGYGSPSEADLALAGQIAFYTQDEGQVRRLVAMSALGTRPKWQREDYASRTIQTAIAKRKGTYDPTWRPTP